MKKALLIIPMILISIFCYSQFGEWTNIDNHEVKINQLATHDSLLFGISNGGEKSIVISSNQGKLWNRIGEFGGLDAQLSLSDSTIYALILNSGTFNYEIYSSNVHTINWSHSKCNGIGIENGSGFGMRSLLARGNILLMGNNNGDVYKSDNYGIDWYKSSTGLITGFGSGCFVPEYIQFLKSDESRIYAGTICSGLYVSEDNGSSWRDLNNGIPSHTGVLNIAFSGSKLFITTSRGMYYSNDYGNSWLLNENNIYGSGIEAIDSNLVVCSHPHIISSKDYGSNWISINNTATSYNYQYTCVDSNSFYIAGPSAAYRLKISDTLLDILNYGLNKSYTTSILKKKDCFFVATKGGGVNISYDNGITWDSPSNDLVGKRVNSLTECRNTYFAGTANGLYSSTDSCKTWRFQEPLNNINCLLSTNNSIYIGTNDGFYKYNLENLSIEAQNEGLHDSSINTIINIDSTIYIGTNNGIYFSNSDNDIWHLIDGTINYHVNSMTNHNCDIYFSSNTSVFRINCNNYNLDNYNFNLPNSNINSILYTDSILIAALDEGAYFFNKNAMKWYTINAAQVLCLAYDSNFVYAGTIDGAFKLASKEIPNFIPKVIKHSDFAVFPNPCSNELFIDLKAIPSGKIKIRIFNCLGQIIDNQELINSNNIFSFECSKYKAGVYYIQINIGEKIYSSKFVKE